MTTIKTTNDVFGQLARRGTAIQRKMKGQEGFTLTTLDSKDGAWIARKDVPKLLDTFASNPIPQEVQDDMLYDINTYNPLTECLVISRIAGQWISVKLPHTGKNKATRSTKGFGA